MSQLKGSTSYNSHTQALTGDYVIGAGVHLYVRI